MKFYLLIALLFTFSFSCAQEDMIKLTNQKVSTENLYVAPVKLVYHFVYQLSFPKRTESFNHLQMKNESAFRLENEFGSRIKRNFRESAPQQEAGQKLKIPGPLLLIDGTPHE